MALLKCVVPAYLGLKSDEVLAPVIGEFHLGEDDDVIGELHQVEARVEARYVAGLLETLDPRRDWGRET